MPRHDSINTNTGYWEAGIKAQEILSASDATAFLRSLVNDFHPRCRTSDDFKRASLSYLDRWKFCSDLWDSLEYLAEELDFVERTRLRIDFFETLTAKSVQSHAELRTIAGNFVKGWLKSHSSKPENIAQSFIRDKWDTRPPLTTQETIDLLKSSSLVADWDYAEHVNGDVTFVDLSAHKPDCMLIAPTDLMPVVRCFVPWELRDGKLYRRTANGNDIHCVQLIAPFVYRQKGERLPNWTLRTEVLNNNWLDWRPENLIVSAVSGKGQQTPEFTNWIELATTNFGKQPMIESRNSREGWKKLRQLESWTHDKISADPVFAKPKAAKKVHSNNDHSQAADKNTDDLKLDQGYMNAQLN